jgi:hypothetical protein
MPGARRAGHAGAEPGVEGGRHPALVALRQVVEPVPQPRALGARSGERYLVSLTGESEWVRNVRAAGGRVALSRGRIRQAVTLVEVPPTDRPAIIRSYVLRAGRQERSPAVVREARTFFGVGGDLDPAEIAAVADRFPVFRVASDADGIKAADPSGTTPGVRSSSPR